MKKQYSNEEKIAFYKAKIEKIESQNPAFMFVEIMKTLNEIKEETKTLRSFIVSLQNQIANK